MTDLGTRPRFSKVQIHLRNWLISSHLTFLYVFTTITVASLQISPSEVNLMFIVYLVLLIMMISLKLSLSSEISVSDSPITEYATPLNNHMIESRFIKIQTAKGNLTRKNRCETYLQLSMLANPTFSPSHFAKSESYLHNSVSSNDIASPNSIKSTSRIWPYIQLITQNKYYLIICNIFHLIALAICFYLNLTLSCSCTMSRFGTALLIPSDCSHLYYSKTARATMFTAIYAAQLLITHLALLFKIFHIL